MNLTELVLHVHDTLYKASGGRMGHHMIGVPTLLLTTTGRKSGAKRTSSLVYARDGEDYLVVASKGGAPEPPAWFLNLKANPEVEIQIAREKHQATARIIEQSDPDYARVWEIANKSNRDRYEGYQKLTSRPIPVIAVTPR